MFICSIPQACTTVRFVSNRNLASTNHRFSIVNWYKAYGEYNHHKTIISPYIYNASLPTEWWEMYINDRKTSNEENETQVRGREKLLLPLTGYKIISGIQKWRRKLSSSTEIRFFMFRQCMRIDSLPHQIFIYLWSIFVSIAEKCMTCLLLTWC